MSFLDRLPFLTFDDLPASARYQKSDIVHWLVAEYACELLEQDPDAAISKMRQTYDRFWRKPGFLAQPLVDLWDRLLDGPPDEIIQVLRRDDDRGAHMRQIMPCQDLLSDAVRPQLAAAASRILAQRPT